MQINPKTIVERGILKVSKYSKIQQVGTDVSTAERIMLKHCEATNFKCNEVIEVPQDMFALVVSRSTYNRKGIRICGCVMDPSFHGQLQLTVYNLSGSWIDIPKNKRVAQIIFFTANPASQYEGKYQFQGLTQKS